MPSPIAVFPPEASWLKDDEAPRAPRLTAGERLRAVAVAPLWLACAGTWGVTSAVMLTWSAVREMPWLER